MAMASLALWASNWGWNSLPDDWSGETSIWGSVDAGTRVTYTLEALDRAEREWPWLGGMILQQWQPDAPPDDPQWGFALIDTNGQPTALWQALVNRQPIRNGDEWSFSRRQCLRALQRCVDLR